MKLDAGTGVIDLGYCTNIHAGEAWRDIRSSLDAFVPAIKAAASPNAPMGIGLRLSGQAAAEAKVPHELDAFRAQLDGLDAYVFTINAFPYGPFHGTRVKEDVYLPDWRERERVSFTSDSAALLAALLPAGGEGSISTVPGAFKANAATTDSVAAIAHGLVSAVADMVDIERQTGKMIALALEPEPCCFLETTDESLAFFQNVLLAPETLGELARQTRVDLPMAERLMRRHLGICYDLCHGSVEYEEITSELDRLLSAGISIPKIQLSTALSIPKMSRDLIAEIKRFDDGVYLHQTVVRNGSQLTRFVDLPDAIAAYERGEAEGEWRIHCHVPVFLSDLGTIGSTQADLTKTLADLRDKPRSTHLEVETYTWDVLPQHLRTGSKATEIAREITFCKERLQ